MLMMSGFEFDNYVAKTSILSRLDIEGEPSASEIEMAKKYNISLIDEYKNENYLVLYNDAERKHIYTQNKNLDNESIIMQFINVDTSNIDQILLFTKKYGLLEGRISNFSYYNDYIFLQNISDLIKYLDKNDEENYHFMLPEEIHSVYSVERFIQLHGTLKQIVLLKSAIEKDDYSQILLSTSYLLFGHNILVNNNESASFNKRFNSFKLRHLNDTLNNVILLFLESISHERYIKDIKEGIRDYDESDYENKETWKNIVRQFSYLLNDNKLVKIDSYKGAIFEKSISNQQFDSLHNEKKRIMKIGIAVFNNFLNDRLSNINPIMQFINNNYIANWSIRNLIDAMYLELFFKYNPFTSIRECPVCHNLFDVSSNDKRKIYCSKLCADRIAKRKQREREKERL